MIPRNSTAVGPIPKCRPAVMPDAMSESTTAGDELVPVLLVTYGDGADLEIDHSGDDPTVENHDEIINNGHTTDEVRALKRSDAEQYNLDIVEPGDPLWDDRFTDLDSGDAWSVDELGD